MTALDAFAAFARQAGVELPHGWSADAKIHRFDVPGDSGGKRNGAYFLEVPAKGPAHGWVMSWKLHPGPLKWIEDRPAGEMSDADLKAWRLEAEALKKKGAEERQAKYALARKRSARLMEKYLKPADSRHPYLVRKGVKPHGAKQQGDQLAIPVYGPPGRTLRGLQFIWPDGKRKFMLGTEASGAYHRFGEPRGTVIIAEGWATAATLFEATGYCSVCAFSEGQLAAVAKTARQNLGPNVRFVIAADNDQVGLVASRAAADAVGARVAVPVFARGESGTDWNDLAAARGLEAVAVGVESALRGSWPPEFLTLAERLARPHRPVSWRIEGWQPAHSRVLLAAAYKSGKTTLRDNLCRALLDGDDFLGSAKVRPVEGTVAVLDTEMSDRQGDQWMREQGIRNGDRLHVEYLRGQLSLFDIRDKKVRSQWAELLRSRNVEYLILDCLRPLLDALNLSEHNEVGKFFVAFDALLSEAGITDALVIHHMGHANERSRGDSRLRDWPECEWRLVRQTDDPSSARFLSAYGRDVDQPEQQVAFDPETRHLTVVGGSRAESVGSEAMDEVLAALERAGEPLSGRATEDALEGDVPRNEVRRALKYGIKRGLIVTKEGPRGAILHRPNPERAAPRRQRAGAVMSERAAPLESGALTQPSEDLFIDDRAAEDRRAQTTLEMVESVFGENIQP